MAAASYDQLLRQVEVLKMENSNLRQELQDNSNHLTKLETEASNMKVSTHNDPEVMLKDAVPLKHSTAQILHTHRHTTAETGRESLSP